MSSVTAAKCVCMFSRCASYRLRELRGAKGKLKSGELPRYELNSYISKNLRELRLHEDEQARHLARTHHIALG